jgi:hypothetical protein
MPLSTAWETMRLADDGFSSLTMMPPKPTTESSGPVLPNLLFFNSVMFIPAERILKQIFLHSNDYSGK